MTAFTALNTPSGKTEKAFDIERYLPLVRSRANAFRQKGIDTDDLFQEGVIGLIYAMRAFDSSMGASFETFAYVCITNRLKNAVTAAGKISSAESYENAFLPDELPFEAAREDPQEILISREGVQQWLDNVKNCLSDFEQRAIRLYLSGYSYQEMAASLQSTTKAVDNALWRARKKLRRL